MVICPTLNVPVCAGNVVVTSEPLTSVFANVIEERPQQSSGDPEALPRLLEPFVT